MEDIIDNFKERDLAPYIKRHYERKKFAFVVHSFMMSFIFLYTLVGVIAIAISNIDPMNHCHAAKGITIPLTHMDVHSPEYANNELK